tara:strand:- start:212 stop:487 length:276 start_codon:yes stop_codon:yes gene_type:complete
MVVTPYTEIVQGRTRTRTFESSVDGEELVWHRDRQTRTVKVLEGNGWRFQLDNQLPQQLSKGDVLHIPKETYHRIIAGSNNLVVEIEEHEN